MKNNIILILITFLCYSCKAQVTTIERGKHYSDTPIGGFYRDTNNLLNPYEGTWLYTNGTTSITVKLRKITDFYNGKCYQDMLVGEYQYIENGVEKINTLNQFNTNLLGQYEHRLHGNSIQDATDKPVCSDCNTSIKRVSFAFRDVIKDIVGDMCFGISNTNNTTAKVFIYADGIRTILTDPDDISTEVTSQVGITIPNGWYTFVKQ